ncbi:hypothetical protein [Puerhibacterium puerhi]|uniref:hypothetical protein n=1 Tax=Puerhibacterium puerhi TaxID=2692623 RepID=UPI0013576DD8|nr:hypothetical protein [Puerhibacterium puerhi]
MDTFIVPVTFPNLDTATRDSGSFQDALRTAGLTAELVGVPDDDAQDDAARPDPGPATFELRVEAADADEAVRRVQQVADGQFPPGMLLLGAATPV